MPKVETSRGEPLNYVSKNTIGINNQTKLFLKNYYISDHATPTDILIRTKREAPRRRVVKKILHVPIDIPTSNKDITEIPNNTIVKKSIPAQRVVKKLIRVQPIYNTSLLPEKNYFHPNDYARLNLNRNRYVDKSEEYVGAPSNIPKNYHRKRVIVKKKRKPLQEDEPTNRRRVVVTKKRIIGPSTENSQENAINYEIKPSRRVRIKKIKHTLTKVTTENILLVTNEINDDTTDNTNIRDDEDEYDDEYTTESGLDDDDEYDDILNNSYKNTNSNVGEKTINHELSIINSHDNTIQSYIQTDKHKLESDKHSIEFDEHNIQLDEYNNTKSDISYNKSDNDDNKSNNGSSDNSDDYSANLKYHNIESDDDEDTFNITPNKAEPPRKELPDYEPFFPELSESLDAPILLLKTTVLTSLEFFTRTTLQSKLRTYTFVVTRVNGDEQQVTSTTEVRPHTKTLAVTDTSTHYTTLTLLDLDATQTLPFIPMTVNPSVESFKHQPPDDIVQEDQGRALDEARYNLATRIMSNGVEVIVAGDKSTLPGEPDVKRVLPSSLYKAVTLKPSTLTNNMMMMMPQDSSNIESLSSSLYPNQFVTKTCLTTFTYLTTYLENGTTAVSSHEQVVSNIATEERNTGKILPTPTMGITLTQYPNLSVGTFVTTYTYLNTILDGEQPLVVTSKRIVTNTVTAPDDYLSLFQPNDKASAVKDTNTYYSTISLEKTIYEGKVSKVISTNEVVTQVVITESVPPKGTSVMTSYIALDFDEPQNSEYSTTDVTKTYLVTYTYFNTMVDGDNTVINTNVSTSSDVVTEKLFLHPKKSSKSVINTTPIAKEPKKKSNKHESDLKIFATKTYLTTFTYYTTLLQEDKGTTSTIISSHSRVVENIETDIIDHSLLDKKYLSELRKEIKDGAVTKVATLSDGKKIEITAQKDKIKPTKVLLPIEKTAMPESLTKDPPKIEGSSPNVVTGSTIIFVDEFDDPFAITTQNPPITKSLPKNALNSLLSSEIVKVHPSGSKQRKRSKTTVAPSKAAVQPATTKKPTIKTPPSPVSNLLSSINIKALTPVLNAMAGLIQTNLKANRRNDTSSTTTTPKSLDVAEDDAISNEVQNRSPIYIPVGHLADIETAESENIAHAYGNYEMLAQQPHHESPLLNGGIPISPGEVITANSDVIVGKPGRILPRIPAIPLRHPDLSTVHPQEVPIGMKPPPQVQQKWPKRHTEQSIIHAPNKDDYIGPPPPPKLRPQRNGDGKITIPLNNQYYKQDGVIVGLQPSIMNEPFDLPEVIERSTGQPLLVNIQPSQVAFVNIPHNRTTALIYGGSTEPHINGQYFDDPSPYPEPEFSAIESYNDGIPKFASVYNGQKEVGSVIKVGAQPIDIKPPPIQIGVGQLDIRPSRPSNLNLVNVDSHVNNHNINVHVPPISFGMVQQGDDFNAHIINHDFKLVGPKTPYKFINFNTNNNKDNNYYTGPNKYSHTALNNVADTHIKIAKGEAIKPAESNYYPPNDHKNRPYYPIKDQPIRIPLNGNNKGDSFYLLNEQPGKIEQSSNNEPTESNGLKDDTIYLSNEQPIIVAPPGDSFEQPPYYPNNNGHVYLTNEAIKGPNDNKKRPNFDDTIYLTNEQPAVIRNNTNGQPIRGNNHFVRNHGNKPSEGIHNYSQGNNNRHVEGNKNSADGYNKLPGTNSNFNKPASEGNNLYKPKSEGSNYFVKNNAPTAGNKYFPTIQEKPNENYYHTDNKHVYLTNEQPIQNIFLTNEQPINGNNQRIPVGGNNYYTSQDNNKKPLMVDTQFNNNNNNGVKPNKINEHLGGIFGVAGGNNWNMSTNNPVGDNSRPINENNFPNRHTIPGNNKHNTGYNINIDRPTGNVFTQTENTQSSLDSNTPTGGSNYQSGFSNHPSIFNNPLVFNNKPAGGNNNYPSKHIPTRSDNKQIVGDINPTLGHNKPSKGNKNHAGVLQTHIADNITPGGGFNIPAGGSYYSEINKLAEGSNSPAGGNNYAVSGNNYPVGSNNRPVFDNNRPAGGGNNGHLGDNMRPIVANNRPTGGNNNLAGSNNSPTGGINGHISGNNGHVGDNNSPVGGNNRPSGDNPAGKYNTGGNNRPTGGNNKPTGVINSSPGNNNNSPAKSNNGHIVGINPAGSYHGHIGDNHLNRLAGDNYYLAGGDNHPQVELNKPAENMTPPKYNNKPSESLNKPTRGNNSPAGDLHNNHPIRSQKRPVGFNPPAVDDYRIQSGDKNSPIKDNNKLASGNKNPTGFMRPPNSNTSPSGFNKANNIPTGFNIVNNSPSGGNSNPTDFIRVTGGNSSPVFPTGGLNNNKPNNKPVNGNNNVAGRPDGHIIVENNNNVVGINNYFDKPAGHPEDTGFVMRNPQNKKPNTFAGIEPTGDSHVFIINEQPIGINAGDGHHNNPVPTSGTPTYELNKPNNFQNNAPRPTTSDIYITHKQPFEINNNPAGNKHNNNVHPSNEHPFVGNNHPAVDNNRPFGSVETINRPYENTNYAGDNKGPTYINTRPFENSNSAATFDTNRPVGGNSRPVTDKIKPIGNLNIPFGLPEDKPFENSNSAGILTSFDIKSHNKRPVGGDKIRPAGNSNRPFETSNSAVVTSGHNNEAVNNVDRPEAESVRPSSGDRIRPVGDRNRPVGDNTRPSGIRPVGDRSRPVGDINRPSANRPSQENHLQQQPPNRIPIQEPTNVYTDLKPPAVDAYYNNNEDTRNSVFGLKESSISQDLKPPARPRPRPLADVMTPPPFQPSRRIPISSGYKIKTSSPIEEDDDLINEAGEVIQESNPRPLIPGQVPIEIIRASSTTPKPNYNYIPSENEILTYKPNIKQPRPFHHQPVTTYRPKVTSLPIDTQHVTLKNEGSQTEEPFNANSAIPTSGVFNFGTQDVPKSTTSKSSIALNIGEIEKFNNTLDIEIMRPPTIATPSEVIKPPTPGPEEVVGMTPPPPSTTKRTQYNSRRRTTTTTTTQEPPSSTTRKQLYWQRPVAPLNHRNRSTTTTTTTERATTQRVRSRPTINRHNYHNNRTRPSYIEVHRKPANRTTTPQTTTEVITTTTTPQTTTEPTTPLHIDVTTEKAVSIGSDLDLQETAAPPPTTPELVGSEIIHQPPTILLPTGTVETVELDLPTSSNKRRVVTSIFKRPIHKEPLPTRHVTHTLTSTVTITKTTVVKTLGGPPSTMTILVTKTEKSTIVDTVTEFHTLLRPTTIAETVLVTSDYPITPTHVHHDNINPTIIVEGTNSDELEDFIIADAPPVQPTEEQHHDSNESFFVVMTDKNQGGVIKIPKPKEPEDETQQRDEMINTNEVNRVLLGGILIASPPSHETGVAFNSDRCLPECKASRNELCQKVDGLMRCICRPGFARMFPDRPCKPTYTYTLKVGLERHGMKQLSYEDALSDASTPEYLKLASATHEGLDRMVMQSDLRDIYHGVNVQGFEPADAAGVVNTFNLQLSDNTDQSRLKEVFKKYLRNNNYSLGGTDLYASKEILERLQADDFDECSDRQFHDCSEHAHCFNLRGTYTCSCREGYADMSENILYPGRICSTELVGCDKCHYHGTCFSRGDEQVLCECFQWYAGENCQVNLKVLLIALVTIGVILFTLLLICIIITCARRRPRPAQTGMSFLPARVPQNRRAGTLDRRAMIQDTSSESGQSDNNTLPPYVAKKPKRPKGALKKTAGDAENGESVSYVDQKDRSLTVMIPRAKYHPAPPSAPHNLTSFDKRKNSAASSNEAKLLSYLDAGPSPNKIDQRKYSKTSDSYRDGPSSRKTSGALVSAGFEVSATVGPNLGTLGTTCGTEADRSENATLIQKISADLLSTADTQSQFNTLRKSLASTDADAMENWLDITPRIQTISESRSYDESTIQPPMKSFRHDYDSKSSQHQNDEANTMAERDLGSTFLLPHTHLYKPDRGSDISGFESL